MDDDRHERCWLCAFSQDGRCTNTFRLIIHVTPIDGIGGQVDFQCTPGMVPEELKPKLTKYMSKFLEKVLPAISMMPFWEEVRNFQLANSDRAGCPGHKERQDIKPYLRLVKMPPGVQ